MKPILIVVLSFAIFFTPLGAACADPKELAFKKIELRFEVNETDGDGEVVLSLKAPAGLKSFHVLAPDDEEIIRLGSKDARKGIDPIGLSQIKLETGEPSIEGVKKAYPEGTYRFVAKTIGGDRVYGEASLSHRLLPAPKFTPQDGKDIDPDHVVVKWQAVKGAAAYEVEIENDDLEVGLTANLPATATSFQIPKGFLNPGTEYEIGVMTYTKEGNLSVAESSFVTKK